jgi:YD repeat-containing protein
MGLLRLRAGLLFVLLGTLAPAVSAQADFSIGASPSSQTVWQAWTVSSLVTITPLNGFSGTVGFTTSGLPAGASASFNAATVSGSGVTTMTISAGPGVPTGSYSVTVTGTSGALSHNAGVSLSVVVPPPISYTYDAVGRLTSVTDQLGSSAIYNYDAVGNVLSISRQNAGTVTISAFSPSSGPVGTAVTILGSGFSSTLNQNSVKFNGISATVTSASNTLLTAVVPAGATTGLITISVSGGMPVTTSSSFTVASTPGPPTITSVTPTVVTQGVGITITGTNFSTNLASNAAQLAVTPLAVQGATLTTISTSTPAVSGSGHVSVQTPYGAATSTDDVFFVPYPFTEANVALATRVNLGTAYSATFTRTKQLAIFIFEGTQGQNARLLFNSDTNGEIATVYKPDGTVLLTSNIPSSSSVIDTPMLPMSGTYAVQVKVDLTWLGQVTLTVVNPAAPGDFGLSGMTEYFQNYAAGPAFRVFVNAGTDLAGNVQLTASGLPGCASPAFSPNSLGTGASQLILTLNSCAAGNYSFTVTGTVGPLTHTLNLTFSVNPLPSGWSKTDIGTTTGYSMYSSGTFTLEGAGDNGDSSHFVYQPLSGDGSIVARVVNLYNALSFEEHDGFAYGGVMIRETLAAGSNVMYLRLDNLGGAELRWRTSTGGTLNALDGPAVTAPYWLKVTRQGGTFIAFLSPDGTNWAQVGSATTISMASSVYIGLATSHQNPQARLAQGLFDNVTITSSPDFSLTTNPTTQSVVPGGTGNYTVSIGALSGFTGSVNLAVSGLPTGTTSTFTPTTVSGSGNSTLAVVTTGSTPFGSYPLTVTATSGSLSHTTNVTLVVANVDFSLSASPSSSTVNVSSGTSYTLTISPLNGFTGTVNLNVTGIPPGASASIVPASITGSGSATVTINTGANTPPLAYPLTFVGTSGSLTHTATASLVVNSTDFGLSLNTIWMTFPAGGGSFNRTVTVTSANGFVKTVTLSATGLPLGASATFNPPTITGSGTSTVTITTPGGLAAGQVVANIVGTVIDTALGNPTHSIPTNLIVQPGGALPSPWLNQDIGGPSVPGASGYSTGALTVQGTGFGITSTSDQFQFLYQPLTGDGTIIARLVSLQNPTGNSRVGVMIRETLAANSAHALMGFQGWPDSAGNRELNVYTRPSTGAATTASVGTSGSSLTIPIWLKLTRQGSVLSGWYSTDGFSWTQNSSGWTATIPMASTVYIGIANGDDNNDVAKTAVFDSVTVTGTAPDFYIAPTFFSRTVSNSANSSYDSLRILGLNGFTGTTSLSTAGLPSGITASVSPSTMSGSGAVVLTLSSSGGTAPGTYPFTFTGTSGSLTHTANLNVTVDSSAPAPLTPWASEDLGVPTLSGSATFLNGTISVQAGDTSGTQESLRFTYQPLAGNSTILARIDSTQFPQDGARAGIMIRETLETGSAFAFLGDFRQFSSTVTAFQYRLASNGNTNTTVNSITLTKPYWVKLTRTGTTIAGSVSPDGIRWTPVGSQNIAMSSTVFVGFAVNSGSTTAYANATFSNISPTNLSDYYLGLIPTTQAAPSGITRTYYSLVLNPLNGFSAAINYTASILPMGATATFGSGSSPTLTITSDGTVPAGTYPFTITGTSGALVHTASGTWIVNSSAANTLLAPWSNTDIGTSATGTGASYSNGVFTATGAGCCLSSGSSDSGQYIYQPLTSDGVIVAKINQNGGTAGLMIRETLSPDSVAAFIGQVSGNATWFATRATIGATDTRTSGSYLGAPFWAKLQRQGSNLSGYVSTDGLTWTQVGSTISLTMASNVFIGMMVSPEALGTSSATFSSVVVANGADFYLTQSQTTIPNAGSSAVLSVNVNSLLGFTGNVTLSASGLPAGATPSFSPNPVTGGSGGSTLTITTTASLSGNYAFTITGTSGTLTRNVGATLSVKNFTVSATPSSQILNKSTSVSYTIRINAVNGFNSTVTPSVATLPAHVSATWNPTTVTSYTNGVGTTTLTLTSTATITSGTTNMTVTGTSGSSSNTTGISVQLNTSPAYSLSVAPSSQTIQASQITTYTVTMATFNGFNSAVTLSASGLPANATAGFNPPSLSANGSSTMTVTSHRATPVGGSTLTVTGSVSTIYPNPTTSLTVTTAPDFGLYVAPNSRTTSAGTNAIYTVTLNPTNNFNDVVTFSATNLPNGATATFNPATLTGSGTTTLTIGTTGLPNATTNFNIVGSSGSGVDAYTRSVGASITIGTNPDFALTSSPVAQSVLLNNSGSFTISVLPANSFAGTTTFSVSGLPAGVTPTFTPTSVTGSGTTSLSLAVGPNVTLGTYTVTVTGTSGSLTHTVPLTLQVVDKDFSISVTPSTLSMYIGSTTTYFVYTVNVSAINGFNSPVTFTLSGQPACLAPTFVPSSLTPTASTQLQIMAYSCTTTGTYPLTITATGNGISHSQNVTLILTDYSLSASPLSQTAAKNVQVTYTITVNKFNGFNETVAFDTNRGGGLPANVTASLSPSQSANSTTLTVSASRSGTYNIPVSASPTSAFGGSPYHTVTVTLVVP